MINIHILKELISECDSRDLCWSIGRSRISQHECRIYPAVVQPGAPKRGTIIIENGVSFEDSVLKAIERIRGI